MGVSLVGRTICEKYIVRAQIGEGATGSVLLAENLDIRRRVAIKVLAPAFAADQEAVLRFQREAQATAIIGHDNIVDVLDMGRTEEGAPYIVMEHLEGETLARLLDRSGRLDPGPAIEIVLQVLAALSAAHAVGIVHRDLKPSNLFLTARGAGATCVKVLDFGVAKFADAIDGSLGLTEQGFTLGTPNYMSPEQARGRALDGRSDLYAVGVILYEMLSGCLPHDGATRNEVIASLLTRSPRGLREVAPDVPEGLAAVIERAMDPDPERRFSSAKELRSALMPWSEVLDLEPPASTPERSAKQRRFEPTLLVRAGGQRRVVGRRWAWLAAGGLVVAGLVLVAISSLELAAGQAPAQMPRVAVTRPPRPSAQEPSVSHDLPPAPAAPILIDVDANVAGARVLLDGAPLGETPLRKGVPARPGQHLLRIEAPGRVPIDRAIDLAEPVRLSIDLEPEASPGRRRARAVRPDGQLPDQSPRRVTFDPFAP
jgi:serine/threonine-protein kinase